MKICVVGTGYVGLVAGTCFAESGNDVVCVDNVAAKIEALRQGHVPIYEPGLEELIRRNVASNPEFLKEGAAIEDFMKPDRVVIGATSQRAIDHMRELYEPFVRTGNPILVMDNASAEMTKYAANALLATRISFMNEIANLCERVGADVDQVRRGIGYDRRIGHHFPLPRVGYGGAGVPQGGEGLIPTPPRRGAGSSPPRAGGGGN